MKLGTDSRSSSNDGSYVGLAGGSSSLGDEEDGNEGPGPAAAAPKAHEEGKCPCDWCPWEAARSVEWAGFIPDWLRFIHKSPPTADGATHHAGLLSQVIVVTNILCMLPFTLAFLLLLGWRAISDIIWLYFCSLAQAALTTAAYCILRDYKSEYNTEPDAKQRR